MSLRILYRDPALVAVDKPAGFHVHPPEGGQHRISPQVDCLKILRDQIGQYVYPVHRLDRATSGVLIFALTQESASQLNRQFKEQQTRKTYFCITRGWADPEGRIELALKPKSLTKSPRPEARDEREALPATTLYQRVATIELPHAVGKYPSARYSLIQVNPLTGRLHQIRRHFSQIAHPLIGDTVYGRTEHNHFFRDRLKIEGLLLKAYSLEFKHPITQEPMRVTSKWNRPWHQVFDLFGICPYSG